MGPKKGRPKKSEKESLLLTLSQQTVMGKGCNAEVKKVLKPTRGRPAKRKFETSTLSYSGVTESASEKESVVVARTSSRGRGRRKVTLSVHSSLSDSNVSDDAGTPVETQSKCSSAHECSNINNNPEVCAEKICNGFIKKYQKSYNYNENFATGSETASNMNSKIVENGDPRLNKSPTELNSKSSIESLSSPSCPTTVECNSPTAPATGNNYFNSNVQQQSTPATTDDVQTQSSLLSPSLTSGDVPLKKRRLRDVVIKDDDGFVIPSPYLIPTQIFLTNNFNDRDTNINNSNKLETTAIYKPDAMTNSSNNNESTNTFDYSTTNNDAKDIVKSIPDDSTTTTTITKTYDPVTDSLTSQTAVEINKKSNGLLLGAHVLYTGDYTNAIHNATSKGYRAMSIFLKDQLMWIGGHQITTQQADDFKSALLKSSLGSSPAPSTSSSSSLPSPSSSFLSPSSSIIARGSCIVDLTSSDDDVVRASFDCAVEDMNYCLQLHINNYCLHLNSYEDSDKSKIMKQLADHLNALHLKVPNVVTVIENSCGEEKMLIKDVEDLKNLQILIEDKSRIGFAIDTCHLFASGVDIRVEETYENFFERFEQEIGMDSLKVIFLNDSQGVLGSQEDEHASIGDGNIGVDCFKRIVNDVRFKNIPFILETPIADHSKNFDTVHGLINTG